MDSRPINGTLSISPLHGPDAPAATPSSAPCQGKWAVGAPKANTAPTSSSEDVARSTLALIAPADLFLAPPDAVRALVKECAKLLNALRQR